MSSSSYSASFYSESTQCLVPMKGASQSQTKDYSRALAELSTSYGFGIAPMPPQTTSFSFSSFHTEKHASKSQSNSRNAKAFSSALAKLQGSYGFQGAPVLPSSR
ncbi:hypothetical protein DL93DRAFT_2162176 [Clavulina sp. PMI_390]|nr:hypothetical protein DL93DRAFT_2162176 [Clavulina sp. PMI_390]